MQPHRAEDVSDRNTEQISSLDTQRFADTPLERAPFDHLIVPGFLHPQACEALDDAFPAIGRGGSFSAGSLIVKADGDSNVRELGLGLTIGLDPAYCHVFTNDGATLTVK